MAEKTKTVTYLGDEDPTVQSVDMFGRTFVKGQAVTIKSSDPGFEKIINNPTFSTDKDPDVVESTVPEPPNPEEGTELQALRDQLDSRGVRYRDTETAESLRAKLAKSFEA